MRRAWFALLLLSLGIVTGCKHREGIALPKELRQAFQGFELDQTHFVFEVLTGTPKHRVVYLFDGHTASKVIEGDFVNLVALGRTGRVFVWYTIRNEKRFGVITPAGFHHLALKTNLKPEEYGYCQGGDSVVVCASDVPGTTDDSGSYNPLGFSAVTVIDIAAQKSWWFPVPESSSYLGLRERTGEIWLDPSLNENDVQGPVVVVDLHGHVLRNENGKGTLFSPSGRFAIPQLHEGGLPWEIYDSTTWKPLQKFEGTATYRQWNPARDLLSVSCGSSENCALEVIDARTGQQIWKYSGKNITSDFWSNDGSALLTIDDNRLVRHPFP